MFRKTMVLAFFLLSVPVSIAHETPVDHTAAPADENQTEPADAHFSPLAVRWELEPETRQGTLTFRPHRQNYFLPYRYSTRPNGQPVSPNTGAATLQDYKNHEAKFQISFKVKTIEGLFSDQADLWFAFTQQSNWQVYNPAISRPFRETNFEPEIMLVFPTNFSLLGLDGRMINLGVAHQSNGQSQPLSRSWNRIYVQFGFERGNFALLVRPWYRFEEQREDDDNWDIDEYLGHGDVQAIYKLKAHTFSLLLRNNLDGPNRGSAQLDWSFPGLRQMKGYVQLFTGYGESMIDYNHHQTTMGLGLILTDVM